MNTLLLYFALPIATIILAIVLEKILRNPFFVAAIFFAIYLVVAIAIGDPIYLLFTIAYTILAFIVAVITEIIFQRCDPIKRRCCLYSLINRENTATLSAEDINRIANQVVDNIQNANNSNSCNCCNCNRRNVR